MSHFTPPSLLVTVYPRLDALASANDLHPLNHIAYANRDPLHLGVIQHGYSPGFLLAQDIHLPGPVLELVARLFDVRVALQALPRPVTRYTRHPGNVPPQLKKAADPLVSQIMEVQIFNAQ